MLDKSQSVNRIEVDGEFSELFIDHIPPIDEIITARSLLHSFKAIICFPSIQTDVDKSTGDLSTYLLEGGAILVGLLHGFRNQSVQKTWKNLPVVVTVPLKKHLIPVYKYLNRYLATETGQLLYIEQARRLPVPVYSQSVLLGTPDESHRFLEKQLVENSWPWFHLVVLIPDQLMHRVKEQLTVIINRITTNTTPIPGITFVFPVTTQQNRITSISKLFGFEEVIAFPPANDQSISSPVLAAGNRVSYPVLHNEEILLPDIYRQMDTDISRAADFLKIGLESQGLKLPGNWFTVGAASGLLSRMRKEPGAYHSKQRALGTHLLRLAHLKIKLKTDPTDELLAVFATLREPGAKGRDFLNLPGMLELEAKLKSLVDKLHPLTAAVIKDIVDRVNKLMKTVVISSSLSILASLAEHCTNAGIPSVSLAGSYHPSSAGGEGYVPPTKTTRDKSLAQFYEGTALILFLPVNQLKYFEAAGVDAVLFHDYHADGKGVMNVFNLLKAPEATKTKEIKLYHIKNTPAEVHFFNIDRQVNKLTELSVNPGTRQTIIERLNKEINRKKQSSKEKKTADRLVKNSKPAARKYQGKLTDWIAVNSSTKDTLSAESSPCEALPTAIVPATWNSEHKAFIQFLNRQQCLVTYDNTGYFEYISPQGNVTVAVYNEETFLETGFKEAFVRSYKRYFAAKQKKSGDNSPGLVSRVRWLVIERQITSRENQSVNLKRLYWLVAKFASEQPAGFQIMTVPTRDETDALLETLINNLKSNNRN
ncbi:MAG: hypothetical protein ACFFD4_03940 [Candidatus Odinarchaeota archaeon]